MGNIDRLVRIFIVTITAVLYWQEIISGTLAYILLAIAGIFALTSFVSFCPLYRLLGLSTCKVKS